MIAPCCSRSDSEPLSEVKPCWGPATRQAMAAAATVMPTLSSCSRRGTSAIRVTRPAAHANRAPRENEM